MQRRHASSGDGKNQKRRKKQINVWYLLCCALVVAAQSTARAQYVVTPSATTPSKAFLFSTFRSIAVTAATPPTWNRTLTAAKQLCSGSSLLLGRTFTKTPQGGTTILRDADSGATVSDNEMSCYRTSILLQTKHILPQTTFSHSLTHSDFKDKLSHQRWAIIQESNSKQWNYLIRCWIYI